MNSSCSDIDDVHSQASGVSSCSVKTRSGRVIRPTEKISTQQESISEDEEVSNRESLEEIIDLLQKQTREILKEEKNLSKKTKSILTNFPKSLEKIHEIWSYSENRLAKLEEKLQAESQKANELKEEIDKQFPSRKVIESTLESSLSIFEGKLNDLTETLEKAANKLVKTVQGTAPKDTPQELETETGSLSQQHDNSKPTPKPRQHSQSVTQQRQTYSDEESKYLRTIIIKAIPSNQKKSGKEIYQTITEHYISYPAKTIENIYTKRNQLEIICSTEENKNTLIRIFQTHQKLNRILNFTHQQEHMTKSIVLGVPAHSTEEDITQAIIDKTDIDKTKLRIFGSREGRFSQKNWLILLPTPIVKQLIKNKGIFIGLKRCIIRPQTSIPRCKNCQQLSHVAARCTKATNCERCGQQHSSENCTNPPNCINCTADNIHRGMNYNPRHKASDLNCPAYNCAYTRERDRLNNIFDLNSPQEFQEQHMQIPSNQPPQLSNYNMQHQQMMPGPLLPLPLHGFQLQPPQFAQVAAGLSGKGSYRR